jgi:hypothetical protein
MRDYVDLFVWGGEWRRTIASLVLIQHLVKNAGGDVTKAIWIYIMLLAKLDITQSNSANPTHADPHLLLFTLFT